MFVSLSVCLCVCRGDLQIGIAYMLNFNCTKKKQKKIVTTPMKYSSVGVTSRMASFFFLLLLFFFRAAPLIPWPC